MMLSIASQCLVLYALRLLIYVPEQVRKQSYPVLSSMANVFDLVCLDYQGDTFLRSGFSWLVSVFRGCSFIAERCLLAGASSSRL
jgi:hypothetical protein